MLSGNKDLELKKLKTSIISMVISATLKTR